MRGKLLLTLLLTAVAVPALAATCLFTVDRTEFVYVTQFGRRVATYDGGEDDGLHVKLPWPVQTVQRLDRRLQAFDLPPTEVLTRDPERNTIDRTLTVDAYVCWRVPDAQAADQFVRAVGSAAGAELILGQRVASELGAAVADLHLDDLVSTDPARVDGQRRRLRQRLLDGGSPSLRDAALRDYGIEVVDVRLRRMNHPAAVRQAIYERIRSERTRKAEEYRSEGEYQASAIRSDTERKVSELKTDAEAKAVKLRGDADAEADAIRNRAASKDPEFYAFVKKLEEYQRILGDGKTLLLLSTHRELFDALFTPPAPSKPGAKSGKGR